MNLENIQREIRNQKLDGWLFFDHHLRDPLAYRVLGIAPTATPTRRWYYLIPAEGEPRGLVHRIERGVLGALPGERIAVLALDRTGGGAAQADGGAAARGHAVFAAMRHPVCGHGGRRHGGAGAQPGGGSGQLGRADPGVRSALDARGARIAPGSRPARGPGARRGLRPDPRAHAQRRAAPGTGGQALRARGVRQGRAWSPTTAPSWG